ncbi:MAG: preprotein translocase subunit SecE [Actinomycetota bacterium]|nr:preprotein translocase subunit SecE [Actinomycetota bacterium]
MNREFKPERARQNNRKDRPDPQADPQADVQSLQQAKRRQRIGARQFLKEVRGELKRVAWPSRKEVASYSLVVLVSVSLITAFIFVLDQAFGQLILRIFG